MYPRERRTLDLPAVHAAVPLAIRTHSDIETALGILNEGRPALVVIETGKLRDWAEMANTLVGMIRASGHYIGTLSDSSPRGIPSLEKGHTIAGPAQGVSDLSLRTG
jgi:hypothetical protein